MKTWELSLTLTSGPPRPQRQCCWPLLLKHAGLFQLFCPWGPRSHWPSPRVPVPASQLVPLLRSWPPTVYSQHSSQNDFFFFKIQARSDHFCSDAFPSSTSRNQSPTYGLGSPMPSALLSPHLSDLHPSSGLHEHARHVLVTLALPWPGMVPFPDSGATYSAHS